MGSAVVDAIQSARVRHYSYINGEYQLFTCKIEGKQNVDKFREWIRKNVAPAFNRHPLDAGIYNEHPNFQLTVYSKPIPEGDDFLFTFPMGAVFEGVTDKSFLDIAKEWGVTLSSGEK